MQRSIASFILFINNYFEIKDISNQIILHFTNCLIEYTFEGTPI